VAPLHHLPLTEIQENPWNPNVLPDHLQLALVENIRRAGFNQPLLVRRNPGEGRPYEVVDGAHRLRAARAAGLERVPCLVVDMDDAEARAQTLAMNRLRGELEPAQVAALIREIEGEIPLHELAEFTGFGEAELESLLDLLDLDWSSSPSGEAERPLPHYEEEEEEWVTLRLRVPESLADLFRSELERLKQIRGTEHDHLALEVMVLNSAQTPALHMTGEGGRPHP
jgi:ParB/RepB/Spo0J family partition protein